MTSQTNFLNFLMVISFSLSIFGRPFLERFALCYRTVVCLSVCLSRLSCLSCLSVTLVYCGQTVGRIKMKLGAQVGLGPYDFVLDGDPARSLNFRPMFIIVIVISLEHYTMHSRYWFVQVPVQVFVFYAFYFYKV